MCLFFALFIFQFFFLSWSHNHQIKISGIRWPNIDARRVDRKLCTHNESICRQDCMPRSISHLIITIKKKPRKKVQLKHFFRLITPDRCYCLFCMVEIICGFFFRCEVSTEFELLLMQFGAWKIASEKK